MLRRKCLSIVSAKNVIINLARPKHVRLEFKEFIPKFFPINSYNHDR